MKVTSQSPAPDGLATITEPSKRIAHRLRVARQDKPLPKMSEEDSRDLQDAASAITLRFDSLNGHFKQHANTITKLQTTTEGLTAETKKLKMKLNAMEYQNKIETQKLIDTITNIEIDREEEKKNHSAENKRLKMKLNAMEHQNKIET